MRHGGLLRSLFRLFGVFVLVVAVLPMTAASAEDGTPIDSPTTLVADHYGSIVITADDVVLDCDGHRIIGEGDGFGVLLVELEGVSIKNCHIEGFGVGIFFYGSYHSTVEANTFTENELSVWAVEDSHSNVIKNNHIVGRAQGISLFGSEETSTYGNLVEGNVVSAAGECFQFRYMTDSRIVGNTASECVVNGFAIGDFSLKNEIKDNIAVGNEFGISLFTNANENLVSENLIKSNSIGILASEQSSYNTIRENRIERNENVGVAIQEFSTGNEVTENRFCKNGLVFWDEDDNVFADNDVCGGGR